MMVDSTMATSTTIVLGMSADGKIAPADPLAPRRSDPVDHAHLEYQTSLADLILIGAGTIRIEGQTYTVRDPQWIAARQVRGQPPQPITCVVSRSLALPPDLPFFTQPIERWILTTEQAVARNPHPHLAELATLVAAGANELDWERAYAFFAGRGIGRVVALGGGDLVAALLAAGRIDDLWLTVWPVIFGGREATTPVEGAGFAPLKAPALELIEWRQTAGDLFLHYRVIKPCR
jgi:5-amino-6-(5-phosphoribosylamino)uracil reductase